MSDNNGFVRAETIEGLGPGVWWRWQEWVTPEPVLDDRTCRWIFGEGFYRTHLTFSPRDQRETCHPRTRAAIGGRAASWLARAIFHPA